MSAQQGVGANIAEMRKLRGKTQHQLARESFVSFSLISKVEAGYRPASPRLIADVARALRVDPAELTGQPYRGETPSEDAVHAPVADLRREISVYDLPPNDYEQPVCGLDLLGQRVAAVTQLRQAASYVKLGARLPDMLRDLRAAAHTYEGRQQERVYGLLAESYDAARALAYKLGYLDLASLIVTRHAYAAARSGDLFEVAVGDTMRAHEMVSAGEFSSAEALMDASLAQVESEISDTVPASVAVAGYLHLEAGLAAARRGDKVAMDARLVEARGAAERIGRDRDDYRLAFGPTNLDIWSVALPVEYGDPVPALERSHEIHLPSNTPRERSSHYYIDLARAYIQQNKPREALDALYTARGESPLHARYHPMVRESTRAIARSMRRPDEKLRSFARWLGVRL